MNELALCAFAAARDAHLVEAPRTTRFAAFSAAFDARAEPRELRARVEGGGEGGEPRGPRRFDEMGVPCGGERAEGELVHAASSLGER